MSLKALRLSVPQTDRVIGYAEAVGAERGALLAERLACRLDIFALVVPFDAAPNVRRFVSIRRREVIADERWVGRSRTDAAANFAAARIEGDERYSIIQARLEPAAVAIAKQSDEDKAHGQKFAAPLVASLLEHPSVAAAEVRRVRLREVLSSVPPSWKRTHYVPNTASLSAWARLKDWLSRLDNTGLDEAGEVVARDAADPIACLQRLGIIRAADGWLSVQVAEEFSLGGGASAADRRIASSQTVRRRSSQFAAAVNSLEATDDVDAHTIDERTQRFMERLFTERRHIVT